MKYYTTGLCAECVSSYIKTLDNKHCLSKDNTGS